VNESGNENCLYSLKGRKEELIEKKKEIE